MIHYSILPLEAVMENMEAVEQSKTVELVINGVTMQVQQVNPHQAMIVRLLSCNPQDFLNPQYAPGRMIEFQPVLQG
ncbi:YlzJ-like family protein [Paenibacillus allorhizosphaerae]|uniref:Uncharacterized protein n=1 Tax=Paenibacillus allorhizosphaerae TaxID=2849866 RepID=A0ABM8VCK3_9BACL|nr:YlzJ-like family protein [Paenibacillus allorhizosphaerae]CAG7624052.1 hypothetical protein PAECIP111802_01020 [Paenibacillus allorhizosphaerae]